jgi:phage-related protein
MIYSEISGWRVKFYTDPRTEKSPVLGFIHILERKDQTKVFKYIAYLCDQGGVLDEPYSRHIKGKIRELRVDFARNRYRIFYFLHIGRTIILLHGFYKDTQKTPPQEIQKAEERLNEVIYYWKNYDTP